VEIASRAEQAEIAEMIISEEANEKWEPAQTFCIGTKYSPPLEDFYRELDYQKIEPPPSFQWFKKAEVDRAFKKFIIVKNGEQIRKHSATTFPANVAKYTTCPNDITTGTGEEDSFYKYRTIDVTLPVKSGRFVFVEVGSVCGPLCGSGQLRALQKNNFGKWIIVERLDTWIS
jgi:hypothetical protein